MPDIVDTLIDRQQRLLKIRSDNKLMSAAWVHYSNSPADFIDDWMVTYDPRVQPSMLPFLLFPKQREYINWLHKQYLNKQDGLVEKSRDMGVTWLSCAFAVWMWLFVPGTSVAFGSRKEDLVDRIGDPDSIFQKMRMIIDNLPYEFAPQGFTLKEHATHMKIINPENGSTIKGEAGDNIGRGGRSTLYFKDESAFYERPELIEAALSMNSDVKIDISTPNGNGNPFYRKRHGGKVSVFTLHWRDDPRKNDEWYRKQRDLLDPVILAREVDLDYNSSVGNVLIDSETVRAAMEMMPSKVFGDKPNEAPVVLGVDVARFGDDRTVLCCRQGREVHWFEVFRKLDVAQVAGQVRAAMRNQYFDAIFIDVVGIGAGVYDILNSSGAANVYAVNVGSKAHEAGKYYNHRAEIWARMRDWLKDGPVMLPNDASVLTDLCSLQYSFNANGLLVLEKKEDAKKRGVQSPDLGDALALTFSQFVESSRVADSYGRFDSYGDTRDAVGGY
jgi:hypothetical protein